MLQIQKYTPPLLVASYFITSVCIYTVCTAKLLQVFWFICLCTNFYVAGNSVIEAFMGIAPLRDARQASARLEAKEWQFPTPDEQLLHLDLIIVAYLPNEQDIILDRVRYALEQIQYPADKLSINVLYNTPHAIEPLESQLQGLAEQHPARLRVMSVPNSSSKADNLNYFLSRGLAKDIVAIFDCDHYPHPYGPRWAMERLTTRPGVDIVQGRCVIFNAAHSLQTAMVAAEFDKIYAVSHPGRSALWGFGLFTGSNGFWRATLLTELRMDDSMLTEDIDSTLRALSRGACIEHDMNVVSYELAPVSLHALWNQRLRWAQGWAQASLRHLRLAWTGKEVQRSGRMRFGLLSLLLVRELSYYLITQYVCLVASVVITQFPKTAHAWAVLIYFQYPVSQWLFIISVSCLLATLWITHRAKSEFIDPWMIVVFSVTYPVYLVITAVVGLYGHARLVSRYSAWNPTARG
ncbi:hypothetical protein ASPZODRAFT_105165 [Penicilliopsis zonata CBS 506.65]|uniref:Glycosyltransferase 2-like domain-containing protein n=1 Tax=Penicilliopsis zonata CBS 506.65 TaxID=1073090 RepID=A0A1L9S5M9_9EURO|nr:hypothetical protein ASPZODRAFT_105165 [Penicilliopsis zonata CBS 506.65]OJJ42465.1 hypothetical protein ASPZODRAFT_105165 [Penicilliopsis zonata CBS 506.65]